jgi:CubicO group peptidase (beta-lactamase class C family)
MLVSAWALSPAACGGKVVDIVGPETANLASVLSYVEDQTGRCHVPGGAVAVVENGKLTDVASFGFTDTSHRAPVHPGTLFQTAGVSKLVVGVAALKLVEEGRIDLARPVTQYVPLTLGAGFDPSGITVQALLTHTSGLPDIDESKLSCATGPGQLGAWFAANGGGPLWTPPLAVWDYSQRGYAAAGWILESVSSQPFEDAVAERVLGPAGMTTATYDPAVALAGDHATGHDVSSSGHLSAHTLGAYDCAASRPPDGVYASVIDYAHLVEALYADGGGVLTPASVTTLETGQAVDLLYPGDAYAYGMYAHDGYKGLHVLRAEGGMHGYEASVWMVPDRSFAVVVFYDGYNTQGGCSTDDTAAFATSTYLGLTGIADEDWKTPPSTWQPYVGSYVDPYVLGAIDVAMNGNTLTATTAAYGTVTLTQSSATAFTGTFGGELETVTFAPGKDGPATWFVTRLGVGARQ